MDPDFFVDATQRALWALTLAGAPLLVPVLAVGLAVGIVQAATSVNEATISLLPKLLVFAAALALFGGVVMTLLTDLTRELFGMIPELTR